MPYIGNEVGNRFVASKAASVYSGDGSTTAFTLEHAVGSDEDILVSVDGVIQEPSVAYAVSSGTTLTFTAAPSSNSGNNIFVYYLFRTVATVDHPSTSSLQATDGTFSSTLNVTGETTLATHLNLGDGDKIKLGASGDLEIYHDGSNSHIDDTGTGVLVLRGNSKVELQKYTGEVMLTANADGAVELYHNDSKKIETTSTGVTVTTAMAAINTGGDAHVQIKGNTRDFKIEQNNYGLRVYDTDASSERLRIDASGALTLDIADDLIIDVAGSDIFLKKAGTTFASFKENSFDFRIQQEVQDKDIVFLGNDGGTADTEVARFDVSETALVLRDGGGSQSNAGRIDIKTSGSVYNIIAIQTTRSATGTNFMEFFNSSGNSAGNINHNGSTTVNFSTSSDYRLKENVTYDFDATSRLKQLKPARFNFIDEPNTTIDGFLAHEAQEVVPIAVSGTKDEIKKWNKEEIEGGFAPDGASEGDNKLDDSGNPIPKYQGIDNSHLVPLLTKALQEQQATIEALTARIVTLENA